MGDSTGDPARVVVRDVIGADQGEEDARGTVQVCMVERSGGALPGGRFWALASDSEEEDVEVSVSSSARSMRYLCRSPSPSATRDLCESRRSKREEKRRKQRCAAVLLSSPISVSSTSSLSVQS